MKNARVKEVGGEGPQKKGARTGILFGPSVSSSRLAQ